jgi:hypothetical protein
MKHSQKNPGMKTHRKSMGKGNHNSKVKQQVASTWNKLHEKAKRVFSKIDKLRDLDK